MTQTAAKMNRVGPHELTAYIKHRSYRVYAVTNTTAAAEGSPLEIVGYELRGPRGNKTFLPKDSRGLVDLDAAALWCDGVAYATNKLRHRAA